MIQKLIGILNESQADAWEIRDVRTHGWEFYFIRHQLDQNRIKDVEHFHVTVYRNKGIRETGFATCEIQASAGEAEICKAIDDLCQRASLVPNKYFTLNRPVPAEEMEMDERTLSEVAEDFLTVMKEIPETETEDLNSYEIFVSEVEERLVTSAGIDVTEKYLSSFLEVVVNARKEKHEIEIYRSFRSGSCDKESLREEIIRAMHYGKDRLKAIPTPKLQKCAVL